MLITYATFSSLHDMIMSPSTCSQALSSLDPFSPDDLYLLSPHAKKGLAKVRFNQILSGQSDSAFEIHASNLCVGVE